MIIVHRVYTYGNKTNSNHDENIKHKFKIVRDVGVFEYASFV